MTDEREPLTYAGVGVDLEKRRDIVERYKEVARRATRPEVLRSVGAFGGLFALGSKYRDPVLVASTDGVGTKVKLAALVGRYEGLGHDLVNQSVNDALVSGAEPLFFLDYVASSDLSADAKVALVKGVADACAAVGCALLGGETSDMPGLYPPGEFDVAGFVVSAVERDALIDGARITAGDLLLGLPSSGLHTNGYTLARAALELGVDPSHAEQDRARLERYDEALGESLADALLKPHRAYVNELRPLLSSEERLIKGLSHITGGGFEENLPRVLPAHLAARLDRASWPVPPIFPYIQRAGAIEDEEMYRVFNMGSGMVVVVSAADAARVRAQLPEALVIGEVVSRIAADPTVVWQ